MTNIVGGIKNSLLQGGTAAQVREIVGKGCGFIMGTEVLDLEGSKPDLVRASVDATREFGVY